jgi:4,5-epoxidase
VGDLTLRAPDGATTRLHAELGGSWVLVAPAGPIPMAPPSALGAHVKVLHRTEPTDAAGDTWLVRPDGHLAWRGTRADDLDRWLRCALTTGHRP